MKKSILFIFVLFLSCIIHSQTNDNEQKAIARLKADLEFLASDAMEGREATTNSENITAQYLVAEMKKIGLSPINKDGSFIQRIPVETSKFDPNSEVNWYDKDGNKNSLSMGKDWATQPVEFNDSLMNQKSKLVFCGYGITADEYNYNDYKDIDVKGKILLLMWGEPESNDSAYFNGPTPTKYYGPGFKTKLAVSKGAAGIIFIPDVLLNSYWRYMERMVEISSVSLIDTTATHPGASIPAIVISRETARTILQNEKYDFPAVDTLLVQGKCESFDLDKSALINIKIDSRHDEIENVIGVIEGTDSKLKNKFITIGAHYDHEGVWNGVVYNGADDNGSGTVAVLEILRNLKQAGLKHSVLGILYSGEEKGLLGSKYFVKNYPDLENLLVNINVDMCGRGKTDSLTSKASQETSTKLYELIQQVDSEMDEIGFYYEPGINSAQGTSDHASFASAGIPAVFFTDDMRVDLHLPSDDADKINYLKILNTTHVVEKLVKKIDDFEGSLKSN